MIGDVTAGRRIPAGRGPAQYPGELMRFLEPGPQLPLPAILTALEPLSGARLLDVGCGIGLLLRAAADRGATPAGVERAEALLEIVRWALPNADLRSGDLAALPFGDDGFDVVTAFGVLRPDDDRALAELVRVTSPGGRLVIGHFGQTSDLRAQLRTAAGLKVITEAEVECAGDVFGYVIATG